MCAAGQFRKRREKDVFSSRDAIKTKAHAGPRVKQGSLLIRALPQGMPGVPRGRLSSAFQPSDYKLNASLPRAVVSSESIYCVIVEGGDQLAPQPTLQNGRVYQGLESQAFMQSSVLCEVKPRSCVSSGSPGMMSFAAWPGKHFQLTTQPPLASLLPTVETSS